MTIRDPDYDSNDERQYECLQCGALVTADSHPGNCSECDAPLRNRQMPYE